jgi:ABC-2 type transport system ATP-binding protein
LIVHAVEATDLHRSYGAVTAVRGVNLAIEAGELFGLIGPDGAGKTTTIGCLAGLMHPSAGKVRILGQDPMARGSSAREQLGLMPQEYSLYGDLSIGENMWFFGQLFGLPKSVFKARAERLLAITRLARFVDRRASALSGGMYKKLALSCALLHEPKVLLLDEPTNGVDPVSRRELWDLIYEFVSNGMAVLISTPYMDEAARCHRVGLIHQGRIIAEGAPGELTSSLDNDVCEVIGGDRDRIDALLAELPEVVAASPAGARLRVVLAPGSKASVAAKLSPLGATLRDVVPDFEDLFLARIRAEAA